MMHVHNSPHQNRPKIVSKTFDNVLVVWFHRSGSFLLLEQLAAEVFQMLQNEVNVDKIVSFYKKKYNHPESYLKKYVAEIIQRSSYYNNKKTRSKKYTNPEKCLDDIDCSFTKLHYKFGNNTISISYGNKLLFNMIHPLFAHLETLIPIDQKQNLKLTATKKNLILKFNGKPVECFKKDKPEFFKGALFIQLYNLIHDKQNNQWLMTIHASGIVKNRQAIIFVAENGGGKSTLAALLSACRYKILSDDFVAVDIKGMVYDFPAAISVKRDAVKVLSKHFAMLNDSTSSANSPNNINVQYIPNFYCHNKVRHVIKAVFILKHNYNGKFIFEELSKKDAVPLLLKESWIRPTSENVQNFFNRVDRMKFYRLVYSDFKDARQAVTKIFQQ